MMKARVLGLQMFSGTSKKTGNGFNAVSLSVAHPANGYIGEKAECLTIFDGNNTHVAYTAACQARVGEVYEIGFDQRGICDDVRLVSE